MHSPLSASLISTCLTVFCFSQKKTITKHCAVLLVLNRNISYLRLVSLCCKNCPSWLHALTRRLGSESMWIMRLIASNNTAFLAFECCTFFDLGGSCALFNIVSKHSVNLFFTAASSEDKRSKCVRRFFWKIQCVFLVSWVWFNFVYRLYIS